MNPTLVCSHTVQRLVLRLALLTDVLVSTIVMLGVHMVPDVGQLITDVVTLPALVATAGLSKCSIERRVVSIFHMSHSVRDQLAAEITFKEGSWKQKKISAFKR